MATSMPGGNALANDATPLAFRLSQNYPNPFKGKTRITYCVAYKTSVKITVLSPSGDLIETLVDETKNPGTYEVDFVARVGPCAEHGHLPCGKYSYRMEAGDYSNEKNMEMLDEAADAESNPALVHKRGPPAA